MVRDYRPSDLDRILKIWLQANIQAHDLSTAPIGKKIAA